MAYQIGTARAHTNIALVKYWGKQNSELILPFTNSISLTLNEFYTTTTVEFSPALQADEFVIDDVTVDSDNWQKLHRFMQIARERLAISLFARVTSINHVPISAGLASSSSAFAALAAAVYRASGVRYTLIDVSRLARRGSGSATRSVFGGLVEWQRGSSDFDSYAVPIEEKLNFPLEMIAILLNIAPKKISSRSGMQNVVETSPYFAQWPLVVSQDIAAMHRAIEQQDVNAIGEIAESNAMRMHALTMSATPPFTYFNAETLTAMATIDDLRQQGVNCYYTMDAGPNVKVIYNSRDRDQIFNRLAQQFGADKLIVCHPGPGIEYL